MRLGGSSMADRTDKSESILDAPSTFVKAYRGMLLLWSLSVPILPRFEDLGSLSRCLDGYCMFVTGVWSLLLF